MSTTATAVVPFRTGGPDPCVDVVTNPPDIVIDPGCSRGAAMMHDTSVGHGDTALQLDVQPAGMGSVLAWETPATWTDGRDANGELSHFEVLRGSDPTALDPLATAPQETRVFEDKAAVLEGGAWYQVVAVGQEGEVLEHSDRVMIAPA